MFKSIFSSRGWTAGSQVFLSVLGTVFGAWIINLWPGFDDFLLSLRGEPLIRYAMLASGEELPIYPIRFYTRARFGPNEADAPLSLTGLVIANPGKRKHAIPLRISAEELAVPIGELQVEAHTLPHWALRPCDGSGTFKARDQVGKRDFCLQIDTFPEKSVVSIFLLTKQPPEAVMRPDKVYVGTAMYPKAGRLVRISEILTEPRGFDLMKTILTSLLVGALGFFLGWRTANQKKGNRSD